MDNDFCQQALITKVVRCRRSLHYRAVFISLKAVIVVFVRPRDLSVHQVAANDFILEHCKFPASDIVTPDLYHQ